MSNNLLQTKNITNTEKQKMTTQINSFNEKLFQEIENEVAANCSGGAAYLYDLRDQNVWLGTFRWGKDGLSSRANDDVSSVKITSGTWLFAEHANYGGDNLILGPGKYNLRDYNFDQKMSSLRRIH